MYTFYSIYFVPPTWSWPFEFETCCLIKDITYTNCGDGILFLLSLIFIFFYLACTRSYNKLFINIFLCFLEATSFFIFSYFYLEISSSFYTFCKSQQYKFSLRFIYIINICLKSSLPKPSRYLPQDCYPKTWMDETIGWI